MIMSARPALPNRFPVVILDQVAIGLEIDPAAVGVAWDASGTVAACVRFPEDGGAGSVAFFFFCQ